MALCLTAEISRKLRHVNYMDWDLWLILGLLIPFSRSQLVWDSEIRLFAVRSASIIPIFPGCCLRSGDTAEYFRGQLAAQIHDPCADKRCASRPFPKCSFIWFGRWLPYADPAATRCQRYRAGGGQAVLASPLAAQRPRCTGCAAEVFKQPQQGCRRAPAKLAVK